LLRSGFVAFATVALLGVVVPAHGIETGLLPNLVADQPVEAKIETSADDGGLAKVAGEPKLLLRFDGYVHNDGKGALDIRGERAAPSVSPQVNEEVNKAWEFNQTAEYEGKPLRELSAKTEEELASPKMTVSQRVYKSNSGAPTANPKTEPKKFGEENEKYLNREHTSSPSTAEMFYVNADGHHHWHLQHVAKYSLWNATKTAEVAPSQKVGFCLEDSEPMEAKDASGAAAPLYAVYADTSPPYRGFCRRFLPNATEVFEGISPGWRDKYTWELGYQWVDISDVAPGEYWLREDVDPEGTIAEEGSGPKFSYAAESTIVPGFDATPQTRQTSTDRPIRVTLHSVAWKDANAPSYAVVVQPRHGEIEPIAGTDEAVYVPQAGYSGFDSFGFTASDPGSEFPRTPTIATVGIEVGASSAPDVAISGTPAEMLVGTSVQLSALVTNDSPGVTWSASAGSITQEGLYTAPSEPPAGGEAVIAARSALGVEQRIDIAIKPLPPAQPAPVAPLPGLAPVAPPGPPAPHPSPLQPPAISRPGAVLIGHELILTTQATRSGRIGLTAYLGHRRLGGCSAISPANRSFTCRLRLGGKLLSARIGVTATLRIGHTTLQSVRPAARIPQMKMAARPRSYGLARVASSLWYWCSASMAM
jgi:hypothetical protein